MVKIGIIGATGYTGLELLRFLFFHPNVEVSIVTSRQFAGKKISELFPFFEEYADLTLQPLELEKVVTQADLFFTALPHQVSMDIVPALLEREKKVIDLSADFRLKDADTYAAWYGPHKAPKWLEEAVYGLPELYAEEIKKARLVANPGCYPTTAILALAPFLTEALLDTHTIVIDAKSGVSGAGRGPKLATHFCETNEDMKAYKVGTHRHTPEIEQELSKLAGEEIKITFVPHLIPISRGMFTTVYSHLKKTLTTEEAYQLMASFYKEKTFVKVLPPPTIPQTIYVRGTNECYLGVKVDERTGRIIIMAAIDNLAKGASTQAVQNMNLMLGFPEETGLKTFPVFP
ncbi:MAG: N-acetyl-gamma-glutamyl-phosphate reductase [Candidatus Desulfofervidaceae bacterium]|nr:N-acetyl-gamma-glutamyl-phosphate reductase [Candidatus Desulfofervidaceae bacterium]